MKVTASDIPVVHGDAPRDIQSIVHRMEGRLDDFNYNRDNLEREDIIRMILELKNL